MINKIYIFVFIPFLLIAFRSVKSLSRDRDECLFETLCDELLELDEYDDPLSDALESDEPDQNENEKKSVNYACARRSIQLFHLPEPDELERFFFRKLLPAMENDIGFLIGGGGGGGDVCANFI